MDRINGALEFAVRHNKHTAIRSLLKPGISVNGVTESGDSLLHIAVSSGLEKTVKTLLELGAHPVVKNKDLITPLQLAFLLNIPTIFDLLLSYVTDINQEIVDGNTILHDTASKGTLGAMESVLRYKPILNLMNKDGYTPLHLAIKSGHVYAILELIHAGADVNSLSNKGESCIHIAVANQNSSVLGLFSILASNIRYKNPVTKLTALHTAAYNGDNDCVRVLIFSGLNVNIRTYNNRTALHEAAEQGHATVVRTLLNWGAEVNALAKYKCTPLHCAAANGFRQVAEILLDKGAYVNAKDCYGNTPLGLAKYKNKMSIIKFLTSRGGEL